MSNINIDPSLPDIVIRDCDGDVLTFNYVPDEYRTAVAILNAAALDEYGSAIVKGIGRRVRTPTSMFYYIER